MARTKQQWSEIPSFPLRGGCWTSKTATGTSYLTYSAARFGDRSSEYHQHRISDRRVEPRDTNLADLYFR